MSRRALGLRCAAQRQGPVIRHGAFVVLWPHVWAPLFAAMFSPERPPHKRIEASWRTSPPRVRPRKMSGGDVVEIQEQGEGAQLEEVPDDAPRRLLAAAHLLGA